MIKRVIVLVFDSVGVGELPDAADYGDAGANTLAHIAAAGGGLRLPVLESLGLGNIISVDGVPPADRPLGSYGKMTEISHGKDTTVGLWEMMGVVTKNPFPTFPKGFPPEIIADLEERIGRKTIGNVVASGTEIIDRLGDEHMRTGCPIVYTSADSVFQIAAHEDVVSVPELHRICLEARDILTGVLGVDRVIARPFTGNPGCYVRTANRKDFGLPPTAKMVLDFAAEAGVPVHSVGKTWDVFSGRGIADSVKTKDNTEGFRATISLIESGEEGIIFTILGDFDTLWGHRNDVEGYTKGLVEADHLLRKLTDRLKQNDLLLIVADHGCDPTMPGTDHSREYVPLIAFGNSIKGGISLGARTSMADVGSTVAEALGFQADVPGISFYKDIIDV